MKKTLVKAKDIESGKKRVNILMDLSDFENLVYCSNYSSISPTTLARSWVIKCAREEAQRLIALKKKVGDFETGNLFEKGDKKTK